MFVVAQHLQYGTYHDTYYDIIMIVLISFPDISGPICSEGLVEQRVKFDPIQTLGKHSRHVAFPTALPTSARTSHVFDS